MWNRHRSLVLSKVCVVLLGAADLAVMGGCPWILQWLLGYSQSAGTRFQSASTQFTVFFYITIYAGGLLALLVLYHLLRLLNNIGRGDVFVDENVVRLRYISWLCGLAAVLAAVSAFYYVPWAALAVAAAFMCVIVRVIKNVMAEAVEMRQEMNYTI